MSYIYWVAWQLHQNLTSYLTSAKYSKVACIDSDIPAFKDYTPSGSLCISQEAQPTPGCMSIDWTQLTHGHHFTDTVIKYIPLGKNRLEWIFIQIFLKFVLQDPIDGRSTFFLQDAIQSKSTMVQVKAWLPAGSKPLSEPTSMYPYGVTRPQWIHFTCHITSILEQQKTAKWPVLILIS